MVLCFSFFFIGIVLHCLLFYWPLTLFVQLSDLRQPFNLQKGWLVWGGIGLVGAVGAIALTGVVLSVFRTEAPEREVRGIQNHAFFLSEVSI